jgi:hypothetical protein
MSAPVKILNCRTAGIKLDLVSGVSVQVSALVNQGVPEINRLNSINFQIPKFINLVSTFLKPET